jgi:exonuclease III
MKSSPLKLASINIEGHKHLDRVVPFIKDFKPDVLCFQELLESDIDFFEKEFGMKGCFLPMTSDNRSSLARSIGIGLFSNIPMNNIRSEYYYGGSGNLPILVIGNGDRSWLGLLQMTVEKEGQLYNIATTHFTWTPDGSTSEKQRQDLKKLLEISSKTSDLIFSGDFNAPRGLEIFSAFAARYKDNIPLHYTTSIDKNLHRAGDLQLMVDGLFTTSEYVATDVKLSEGVSDHLAITALISKLS